MCIIAICDKSFLPKDEFIESFRCNKDGFGMAWRGKEKVEFVKGYMTDDDAWATYKIFQEKFKNCFPHVLHFRLGSPIIPELTHPFIVNEDSDLLLSTPDIGYKGVLFHNGIVSGWRDMLLNTLISLGHIPDGEWSDTRMVAILINKVGKEVLEFINGKFVFMDMENLYVKGEFTEDADFPGIRFSNSSYKTTRKYIQPVNHNKKEQKPIQISEPIIQNRSTWNNICSVDEFIV